MSPVTAVRPATPDDVPAIVRMVRDLAEYEKALHEVDADEGHVTAALFPEGGATTTFAHVAEVDGEVVGMAVWFLSYSTWTGTHGVWLEDLYVAPERRGLGLGQELLRTLAQVCVDARLPPARVVGPRLEHPEHRLLRVDRGPVAGRVDPVPPRR